MKNERIKKLKRKIWKIWKKGCHIICLNWSQTWPPCTKKKLNKWNDVWKRFGLDPIYVSFQILLNNLNLWSPLNLKGLAWIWTSFNCSWWWHSSPFHATTPCPSFGFLLFHSFIMNIMMTKKVATLIPYFQLLSSTKKTTKLEKLEFLMMVIKMVAHTLEWILSFATKKTTNKSF